MSEKITYTSTNVSKISVRDNSRCVKSIRDRIRLLCHGLQCLKYGTTTGNCSFPYCDKIKNILQHMAKCHLEDCPTDLCFSSRKTLNHWEHCKKQMNNNCIICQPLKMHKKPPPVVTIEDNWPSVKLQPQFPENHFQGADMNNLSQTPSKNPSTSDKFTEIHAISKEVIKKWHIHVTPNFRARVIKQFIKQIFPACNRAEVIADKRFLTIENYAKQVEAVSYEHANSLTEYHQMIADRVGNITSQLNDKQRETKRLIRQFLNDKKNKNSTENRAIDMAIKTENSEEFSSQKINEDPLSLPPNSDIKSSLPLESGELKYQWPLGLLDEEWHQFVVPDVREYFVYQIVHLLFPVSNVEILFDKRFHEVLAYAKKIENDVFVSAKSPSEYYHSLLGKLKFIEAKALNR